ncbi:Arylsulfatase [Tetrabaena socialis]|uniref:Arylsulfatase n=1 Tax=Tetrabaena socialis TaxID=47790 RepID=A0A2J8ACW0_9CHLO|nr:Arylsulfatase [Tetrabaena socialis]|eukprot:PNH10346.1 Arylsulfatase [Tetrabaena socialis]
MQVAMRRPWGAGTGLRAALGAAAAELLGGAGGREGGGRGGASGVETLNASGVLDNTYIIYSSDNGYHVGTHRFGAGKVLPYEEDLRVPFLIRGPGIKASKSTKPTNTKVGLHVDFAPTILTLAGAGGQLGDKALDGTPLGLAASDDGTLRADYPRPQHHRNQFQAEFWGSWIDELLHHLPGYVNNTWKAVRVYDEERNGWKYIYSCTGSKEIYDLKKDPGELNNMYDTAPMNVRTRLEALLAVLAVCRGDTCTNPWKVLHPGGEVQSWSDAIKSKYDDVYARIKPFKFVACLGYQDLSNEMSEYRVVNPASISQVRHLASVDAVHIPVTLEAPVERFAVPVPKDVLDSDVARWYEVAEVKYHFA